MAGAGPPADLTMPRFHFDTQWLKLPKNVVTGEIVAISVDRADQERRADRRWAPALWAA
ncbi:MAG TPA: hypothetical protein VF503_16035 [Sphingobium sp.]|uniref:hypothetical protein n=1 Tax=Sphingobium sp. TaxID=1912891 RepID=UPI002ED07574